MLCHACEDGVKWTLTYIKNPLMGTSFAAKSFLNSVIICSTMATIMKTPDVFDVEMMVNHDNFITASLSY